ncbi:MAG: HD domain-containing protein [Burkholderiaceae bacterium]
MGSVTAQQQSPVSEVNARRLAEARLAGLAQGGEILAHAAGTARVLAELGADEAARAAAWLFGAPETLPIEDIDRPSATMFRAWSRVCAPCVACRN